MWNSALIIAVRLLQRKMQILCQKCNPSHHCTFWSRTSTVWILKNFNYLPQRGSSIYFFIFYVWLFFRYGREYADPYLGHSIGPVAGYGVSSHAYYVEHLVNNVNFILLIQSFSLVSNPKLNLPQNLSIYCEIGMFFSYLVIFSWYDLWGSFVI